MATFCEDGNARLSYNLLPGFAVPASGGSVRHICVGAIPNNEVPAAVASARVYSDCCCLCQRASVTRFRLPAFMLQTHLGP
jgi:hypothetical protein